MGEPNSRDPSLVHLPTRASELRAQADAIIESARAKAAELQARAQEEAETLLSAAAVLERLASGDDSFSTLRTSAQDRGNVRTTMQTAQKLAIAAKHSKSRLADAVRAAGYSLRDFAKLPSINVPESTLRYGHSGNRPIDEDTCMKVQNTLGKDEHGHWRFPATEANWPRMGQGRKKNKRPQ